MKLHPKGEYKWDSNLLEENTLVCICFILNLFLFRYRLQMFFLDFEDTF